MLQKKKKRLLEFNRKHSLSCQVCGKCCLCVEIGQHSANIILAGNLSDGEVL